MKGYLNKKVILSYTYTRWIPFMCIDCQSVKTHPFSQTSYIMNNIFKFPLSQYAKHKDDLWRQS